jgi:uncharacterized protein (UPF0264 family)
MRFAAPVTRMLASVRSVDEARVALAGGADVIDLKEPLAGPLGAVPASVAAEVVRLVDGRAPVSAAVGDLPASPALLRAAVEQMAATGVSFVKVGLFGRGPFDAYLEGLAPLARLGVAMVAVLFADCGPDFGLLGSIAAAGFQGVMLDTADKRGAGLRTHLSDEMSGEFVRRARRLRLFAGLAGSLTADDIVPLLRLRPDYLGFRGALCVGQARGSALDPDAVAAVRRRIPAAGLGPAMPAGPSVRPESPRAPRTRTPA